MIQSEPITRAQATKPLFPAWLERTFPPLVSLVVFLALWQGVIILAQLKPYVLPGPLQVINAFIERRESLIAAAWFTFQASFVAFLVVLLLGTALSFLLSSSKFIEKALYPYAVMLQSTPVIAIAPIIIIWFDIGFASIVTISVIIAIFAVVANTTQGLISVENNLQNLFKLYGASKPQTLFKLRLPFALPYMVTGWRIAAAQVVIGTIVGEYMAGAGGGGMGGLGIIIAETSARLQTSYLFASALSAALLGIGFFLMVNFFGYLLLKNWHESAVQHEN
ncbi:MAG: ABC transporter permease [Deinococcales bacterium]